MPIIKNQEATKLLKQSLVLDLGDVVKEAKRIRDDAQAEARRLVTDARNDAETIRNVVHHDSEKKGHEVGLAKGLEEGRQQGLVEGRKQAVDETKRELEKIQQAWLDAMGQWEADRQQMLREAKQTVLNFALKLAQKVAHRTLEIDRGVIVEQLSAALLYVLRPSDVSVRVCPRDRAVLEEAMPKLLERFPQAKHIHLIEDEAIGHGGCVLSYGRGEIDATVETQMQRLAELIAPDLPDEQADQPDQPVEAQMSDDGNGESQPQPPAHEQGQPDQPPPPLD